MSNCPQNGAIVSLTYDDNLASQIDHAIPALNEYGFKGTFFINDVSQNTKPWQVASAAGHELGSHTVNHPCTQNFDWVKKENASEAYTSSRMADELDQQIQTLAQLGQSKPMTFAYPCGTTWIGSQNDSYIPLVRKRFIAARGVEGKINRHGDDLSKVGAYFIEGTGDELIAPIKEAVQLNGWVVLGFHGIGGDYLSVTDKAHRDLLQWLSNHQETVRVLPFRDAAACMQ